MNDYEVAVVGSGFAGTIMARILHRLGIKVALIERHRHPRFAIGESSTPLAAICLERLAEEYEMPDLAWLAAYGRWMETIPEVRRGLKRGFTFYRHLAGEEFQDHPENDNRLLVAASPDDAVADSHWLRQDVDHHLVRLAVAEGVDYREDTELQSLARQPDGRWILSGIHHGQSLQLSARVVIDGSGEGQFLAQALPLASNLDSVELDTALVYGHFRGLTDLPSREPDPYPEEKAAVHHLLDEGWMYVLPFDHGVVSAGILMRRESMDELGAAGVRSADHIWTTVLARYPTLENQFESSVAVRPLQLVPRLQRRLSKAAGDGWALLPHTYSFLDPMFSTGIAWSLRSVERLGKVFAEGSTQGVLDPSAVNEGLQRYQQLLEAEAHQMTGLLEGAYLAMRSFDLFTAHSFLYFATVSFEEVDQRLFPQGHAGVSPAWSGFLGATDPGWESVIQEANRRLNQMLSFGGVTTATDRREFCDWVAAAISRRNIAGLADPSRRNLYPVDLDLLVERASLMGLSQDEMRKNLPKLRGLKLTF